MRQFDAFLPLTTQHDEWQHEVVNLGFGTAADSCGAGTFCTAQIDLIPAVVAYILFDRRRP